MGAHSSQPNEPEAPGEQSGVRRQETSDDADRRPDSDGETERRRRDELVFRLICEECDGWDSVVSFTTHAAAKADKTRHNRDVHGSEDGPAVIEVATAATDGGQDACPNCGGELHETGNPTPGNSPEKKCRSCRWLNWHGRPEHTAPPYDDDLVTDGGRETRTFHQAICEKCANEGSSRKKQSPKVDKWSAEMDRDIHNDERHAGEPEATVRTFEAEAIGSGKASGPVDRPELPFEDGGSE